MSNVKGRIERLAAVGLPRCGPNHVLLDGSVKAGVPIVEDESVPNIRRFYASDPFGNCLEFIEDADRGFAERR